MKPKETFKTPEDRGKFVMLLIDNVKAEMQSGLVKDFGTCIDGSGGFLIYDAANESDVFSSIQKWVAHMDFDARQVLTVDQLLEARKGSPPLTGKQSS